MAREIGFLCDLKLPWLNWTARLVSENLPEEELKRKLDEYLSFEIKSPTNIRKTREILLHVWYYENRASALLFPSARSLLSRFPEESPAVHWALMLPAYPVFADLARLIGKMAEFHSDLTLSQMRRKMSDEWGERSTLFKSIKEQIATMRSLGVLEDEKPGKYRIVKHEVRREETVRLLLCAALAAEPGGSCAFQKLISLSVLFPFTFQVEKKSLLQDDRFEIKSQAGERILTLRGGGTCGFPKA